MTLRQTQEPLSSLVRPGDLLLIHSGGRPLSHLVRWGEGATGGRR